MEIMRSERICRLSDLGRLQKAATLRYDGEERPGGFELRLSREQEGTLQEERVFLHGASEKEGECLLQFLYENAVPIENWKDVLQEARRQLG